MIKRHSKWLDALDYNQRDDKFDSREAGGSGVASQLNEYLLSQLQLVTLKKYETEATTIHKYLQAHCLFRIKFMRFSFSFRAHCEAGYYHIYPFNELYRWQQEEYNSLLLLERQTFHLV